MPLLARTPTLAEAAALLSRQDYAAAAQLFSQALAQDDQDVQACQGLAWSLFQVANAKLPILRSADQQLALNALRHALNLEPENARTVALLSLCFMNAGAPERASELLKNFLSRNPYDVQAVGLLADLAAQPELAAIRLGFEQRQPVYAGPRLRLPKQRRFDAPSPDYLNVSYSQEGEDLVLARIFGEASVGVYVDVGAHHPLRFSNTHKFYLQGWRGVNIEPNPALSAIFQAVRPEDVNLTCGVSDDYGSLTYYMFNEAALNSFDEALAHSREGDIYKIVETRLLDVVPLSAILEQCLDPGTPIQFLSVDVEGLDLKVLRSNDWTRFRPQCVVAECLASDVETVLASPLHDYLQSQRYRFFAKTFNSVFYLEAGFCSG